MTRIKSESTMASIMAAAENLFIERNYADVTMDQIASGAQVTKGAVYYHFSGKEELYLKMLHTDLEEKKKLFKRAVDSSGNCRKRLRRLTEGFFLLPHRKRALIKLVRRDINIFADPARTGLVRAYQAALPELVECIIRDGIRDMELAPADPRLLSWYYVALVEVVLSEYAERVYADTDEKLDQIERIFFDGTSLGIVRGGSR